MSMAWSKIAVSQTVFRDSGQKFLTYDVDELSKHGEEAAFLDLGRSVGCPPKAVKRAYQRAKKAELAQHKAEVQAQEALFRQEGLKILIAAHSYVAEDPCMGKPVTDYLRGAGVLPLRADLVDREGALKRSRDLSPTCKWEINREILGGIVQHRADVDGMILLSAFPCGQIGRASCRERVF